jgi:uncharacterized protein
MELPLFPLNAVLFPRMPIRLRIFEERYKLMINECRAKQTPFGVVLIEAGREVMDPLATPHKVGTTAYIAEVRELTDGNMNIVAMGRDRFQIQSLDNTSKPYLMGEVEIISLANQVTPATKRGRDLLKPLISRYLKGLVRSGDLEISNEQMPKEPLTVAYLSAMLLQTENDTKQAFLEAPDTKALLEHLIRKYRKEVTIMDLLKSPPPESEESEDSFPFSLN